MLFRSLLKIFYCLLMSVFVVVGYLVSHQRSTGHCYLWNTGRHVYKCLFK